MNKQDFINKGFKEYPLSRDVEEWADCNLEKRYLSKEGRTKYFIHIYCGRLYKTWEARVQFETNNLTLNLELFSFNSFDDVENTVERIWNNIKAHYYD